MEIEEGAIKSISVIKKTAVVYQLITIVGLHVTFLSQLMAVTM